MCLYRIAGKKLRRMWRRDCKPVNHPILLVSIPNPNTKLWRSTHCTDTQVTGTLTSCRQEKRLRQVQRRHCDIVNIVRIDTQLQTPNSGGAHTPLVSHIGNLGHENTFECVCIASPGKSCARCGDGTANLSSIYFGSIDSQPEHQIMAEHIALTRK